MQGIQLKHYLFKATLLPTLVTLILLCVMTWLAFWQLDRAEYKNNIQTQIENKQGTSAISIFNLADEEKNWLYQPVFATGKFDNDHNIYLDNQVHDMVAGYSIFTPLLLSDNKAVLVNRGWLPLGKSRATLPDVSIDARMRRISGLATNPPSSGLILSSDVNFFENWPTVLQYINLMQIEKEIGYKLIPIILTMNNEKQTTLKPLPIKINMRAEKHTAYAFQWFGLSLALLTIYFVVNTTNTKKE